MIEDLHTEFKREWKSEYLRNVAALANTDGGVLHIGIDDDGTVHGVRTLDKDLKQIPDEIHNVLGIVPVVDHYVRDGKECISITVKKSNDPVFFGSKILVKSGSTTRALSGSELKDRLLKSINTSWVDIGVSNVDIGELSKEALEFFMKSSNRISPDADSLSVSYVNNILLNLGLLNSYGNLTRAAVILFHPDPSKYIPDAYLRIGEFDDRGELLREQYLKYPMIMMPEKASEAIYNAIGPGHFDYNHMQRRMVYRYPPEAIREILINAIIHNNYALGRTIDVKIYRNRISVFNFGELPDGWDIDTLLGPHPSVPRNRIMAEVFHEAGFVEKWGKGIGTVLAACDDAELPQPTFEVFFKGLLVTFNEKPIDALIPIELTQRERVVLEMIRKGEFTTNIGMAEKLSVSRSAMESTMRSLKSKKLIERVGSDKNGHWRIC